MGKGPDKAAHCFWDPVLKIPVPHAEKGFSKRKTEAAGSFSQGRLKLIHGICFRQGRGGVHSQKIAFVENGVADEKPSGNENGNSQNKNTLL